MGGFGSTRWFMHTKKVTVEACRILDIHQWIRTKLVQPNVRQTGAGLGRMRPMSPSRH